MPDELVYHQQTVSILDPTPLVSSEALAALDERERALGIRIPTSVREWYSLEGAVTLLATYRNDDHPVRLEELGEPDVDHKLFASAGSGDGRLIARAKDQHLVIQLR
jgi:hypothetical protein